MNIQLTKKQYKDLIMMTDLANSVLGFLGDHIERGEYKKISNELEETNEYLLRSARDFGCGDMVESWEGRVILKEEISEKYLNILKDFEEFVLFDLLANKLAWRDFKREHSQEERQKMAEKNGGYFGVELYDYEKKYWDEFEGYGYDRLEVNKR